MRSALLNGVAPALPTLCALAGTLLLFVLFLLVQGKPAGDACLLIYQGAFGTLFAWQNTLQRAAPLLLTALCVALPARVGLIVIGGEGALALGGL
ncbi:ABC transporter permease, partial [Herbaspirillum frisingense]